jgi:hypothetical protein
MKYVGWLLALVVAVSVVGVADPVLDLLEAIDAQVSGLSITLGSVSSRMDDLKTNVDNVGDRVGNLSLQLDDEANAIKGQLATLDDKANISLSLLDDLQSNIDNVHISFGGLSDQLAAESDEIKWQLGDGFGDVLFLIRDFGGALVQMNQGQISMLQAISDNTAEDHDALGQQMDQGHQWLFESLVVEIADLHDSIGQAASAVRQTTWNAADYIAELLLNRFDSVDGRLVGLEDRLDVVDAKLDQLLECCTTLGNFEGSLEEVIALLNYIVDSLPPGWDNKAMH